MTEPATISPLIRDNFIRKPAAGHESTLQEPSNLENAVPSGLTASEHISSTKVFQSVHSPVQYTINVAR